MNYRLPEKLLDGSNVIAKSFELTFEEVDELTTLVFDTCLPFGQGYLLLIYRSYGPIRRNNKLINDSNDYNCQK